MKTKIKGLSYLNDFLNLQEEKELIEKVDNAVWLLDLKRRVQHYGYKYDYKKRGIDRSMKIEELPDWTDEIIRKLINQKLISYTPNQLIINEYEAGQGIASHIDCEPCFENTIISLSLNAGCTMDFIYKHDRTKIISLYLEPRSLLVLQEEARYEWLHGIKARKTDHYNNQTIPRQRRISLTFRKVILSE